MHVIILFYIVCFKSDLWAINIRVVTKQLFFTYIEILSIIIDSVCLARSNKIIIYDFKKLGLKICKILL